MKYLCTAFSNGVQIYSKITKVKKNEFYEILALHKVNTAKEVINLWNNWAKIPNTSNLKWNYKLL